MDLFPNPGPNPVPVDSGDGVPVGKFGGKESPLAPGSDDVQDGIDDLPPIDARSSSSRGPGDESANQ